MGVYDYKNMDTAPTDGTVVLVLTDTKYPRSAYKDATGWHYYHSDEPCGPIYWMPLPADPPSDFKVASVPLPSYRPIAEAPTDGSVVLVLVNPDLFPVPAYYSAGDWILSSDGVTVVVPEYWVEDATLPAGYP